VAGSPSGSNLLGYLRVDYKQGANVDAWGLNAGLRYQFDPSKKAATRAYDKSPVIAPVYDWSGFYLGGFLGGAFAKTDWSFPGAGTANPTVAGGLGGVELGYNGQFGPWVLGVEGDIGGTNARGGQSCVNNLNNVGGPIATNCNYDVRWLGTVTGRLGYAWDAVLLYGKLGGAWVRSQLNATCNTDAQFPEPACFANGQNFGVQNLLVSDSRGGWTAGIGVELGLTPNWSAKVEYDYLGFGSKSIVLPDASIVNIRENIHEVKLGVNYHFAPYAPDTAAASPTRFVTKGPIAAPLDWSGIYIGASIGERLSYATWDTNQIVPSGCSDLNGNPAPCQVDVTTNPASFFNATFRPSAYLGYNWQFLNKWVLGIEGDFGWGNTRMTRGGIPGAFGNGCNAFNGGACPEAFVGIEAEGADSSTIRLGGDGSIRGRFGVLVRPATLLYATGGVAFQQIEVGAACDGSANSWCAFGPKSETFSRVMAGWTIGGGAEAMFDRNWLGRMEFRYARFGDVTHTFFAGTGDDIVVKTKLESTVTFLVGIGYKFDNLGYVVTR
jgi:opacity protein-like surface antigen